MPITLKCACGKTLRVADEHAGKRVKCPVCGAVIAAPPPAPPEPMFEVVDDPPPLVAAKTKPNPKSKRDEDDEDGDRAYGVEKAAKATDPPKAKPKFRKRADDDDHDDPSQRRRRLENEAAGFNAKRGAYVVGGIIAAAAGIGLAIWGNSSTGRGATRLLVVGILLGVFGLISVVQGLTGNMPDDDD